MRAIQFSSPNKLDGRTSRAMTMGVVRANISRVKPTNPGFICYGPAMTSAYINRIATATPPHDVHAAFLGFARSLLAPRQAALFDRMAERAGIAHRYSILR